MLNYLGPNFGSAPAVSGLPPATPGTMPSGVPGAAILPTPLPPAPHGHPAHTAVHPRARVAASALAAILQHAANPSSPAAPPAPPEYGVQTQDDGTILLHLKNPDGTLGPVVKVIPAIKRQGQ